MSYEDEKDKIRTLYPYVKKGVSDLTNMLKRTGYWLSTKFNYTRAQEMARTDATLAISASDGTEVTADKSIEFNFAFLKGDEYQVAASGSGVLDDGAEFTLVGKNNGWNFKIKKADFGPYSDIKFDNIIIKSTAPTDTTVTFNPSDDGEVVNAVSYTSGRGGTSPAWNSSDVINDTTGTNIYTTSTRFSTQATKNSVSNKWFCGRPLLYFDTSTIPSGKTITSLKLKITLQSAAVNDSYGDTVGVFEWDEFALARGTRIQTTDFDGFDIQGPAMNPGTTGDVETTWDITGTLLSNFQSNYTSGYGFMLRNRLDYDGSSLTPAGDNYHRFYSNEHSEASKRPKLEVTYE